MNYPREYLAFAERYVREHPRRERDLRERMESIASVCRGGGAADRPRGERKGASEQERIMEAVENDAGCRRLARQIERVRAALTELTEKERLVIELLLWDEMWKDDAAAVMGLDVKTLWRLKNSALEGILPFIVEDLV